MSIHECECWSKEGKMKTRSLAVDQTSCTRHAFKFAPKKLYCPIGETCFAARVYKYKCSKNTVTSAIMNQQGISYFRHSKTLLINVKNKLKCAYNGVQGLCNLHWWRQFERCRAALKESSQTKTLPVTFPTLVAALPLWLKPLIEADWWWSIKSFNK